MQNTKIENFLKNYNTFTGQFLIKNKKGILSKIKKCNKIENVNIKILCRNDFLYHQYYILRYGSKKQINEFYNSEYYTTNNL